VLDACLSMTCRLEVAKWLPYVRAQTRSTSTKYSCKKQLLSNKDTR
jgi:hypothetical protein